MIDERSFVIIDDKYRRGFGIDEYDGIVALCECNYGSDDKIYAKWGFPQNKNRQPIAKAIPWKITLGYRRQAIDRLQQLIDYLEGSMGEDGQESGEAYDSPNDDIPF